MKVLRTIESFLPKVTGPARQAWSISENLEKIGWSSPVVTTYMDVDGHLPRQETLGRVAVTRLPVAFRIMRYAVSPGMGAHLRRCDLIHSHNYRNFQTDYAYWRGHGRRPFILSTHGSLLGFQHYLPQGPARWPYRLYDALTLKAAVKGADAVVVSSPLEYEDGVRFGAPSGKIRIIPMGIDVDTLSPARHENGPRPLRLLFAGRIARVRRVERILQAVKQLQTPWELVVVGGEEKTSSVTRSGYLAELNRLTADLGITDRVRFEGPRTPEALANYYQNADVFLYASQYENFGQPLLEAAAHGVPLVSTPVGAARELIRPGETGFLVDDDPATMARRIEDLQPPAVRREFGAALRTLVRDQFGWSAIMDQYLDLYRKV
ncbi:MAG: glycosyltransferase family 4 protein [Nitrospinaceae bacterium]